MQKTSQISMFGYTDEHKRMRGAVVEIGQSIASDFLLPRHYSGRIPNIVKAFGWFIDGELKAVCTFGKPASPHLCDGVCGGGIPRMYMNLTGFAEKMDLMNRFQVSFLPV